MRISNEDRATVRDAIRAAETATSGDFVCVLAQRASAYEFYPLAWATVLALAAPWVLLVGTDWPFTSLLALQGGLFVGAFLLLSVPAVRHYLVPRRIQRAAAYRAATEQFFIHGLAKTPNRRGVLIYVAHDEHYARILADEGAATVVPAEHWQQAVSLLVEHARRGHHTSGFVAALAHCADVMKAPLPPEHARVNALPDRFHVID